ncbi:MAG TPA: F0F1 ATP synthase subunit A [Anaerolineales bacterium]|nr:F0F1 ATP synthase subunit A [Anaerolineales bacterium]
MAQTKERHWRRWVVLALMILGPILILVVGGIFVPVQPFISVAPEKILLEPIIPNFLGLGPLYLTNTLTTLIATLIMILILAYFTNRSLKKSQQTDLVPSGVGNAMEAILEMIYNLTEGSAGQKWVRSVFPWFATILVYVLFANLLRLIPGFETIGVLHHAEEGIQGYHAVPIGAGPWHWYTAEHGEELLVGFFRGLSVDMNFTLALALISVFMTQVIGVRAQGRGYWSKFFNTRRMFKVPFFGAMDFLVGLLEIISELSKILSFTFRLFGNMFAGVVLVAIVVSLLGFITILPAMLMLFELFVGLIQAFVFGMLTMVFMAQATQGHGEEHAEVH